MSKRAEQRAMEAYPPTFSKGGRHPKRVQSDRIDTHQPIRAIYIKGYEQAEKDTLNRAILWLKENAESAIKYCLENLI